MNAINTVYAKSVYRTIGVQIDKDQRFQKKMFEYFKRIKSRLIGRCEKDYDPNVI